MNSKILISVIMMLVLGVATGLTLVMPNRADTYWTQAGVILFVLGAALRNEKITGTAIIASEKAVLISTENKENIGEIKQAQNGVMKEQLKANVSMAEVAVVATRTLASSSIGTLADTARADKAEGVAQSSQEALDRHIAEEPKSESSCSGNVADSSSPPTSK